MLSRFALSSAASTRSAIVQKAALFSTASRAHLIVNAVGKDRLGIVSDVSKHVVDFGGNVGKSNSAKLGNHFSMMMLVHVPLEHRSSFEQKLKTMDGLQASVFETQVDEADFTPKIAYSGYFELEGADHPGIVHKLTAFMTRHGLSVDKLETSDEIAPHGGTTLFQMKGTANALEPLAAGFDIDQIKRDLAHLADELNCDITLEDRDPGSATSNYNKKVA